jgi:steroid 5-alpha reductase family enzyme
MLWLAVGVALFLSGAMALAWRVALTTGQSGRIDAIWAFATGLAAVAAAAAASQGDPLRRILVCAIAAAWSLRLGLCLWRRAIAGADDPRYAALKQSWGEAAGRRLFLFLQIQAVASWPLALTAYWAAAAPRPGLDGRDGLAIALFAFAFAGETIADRQMARFKRAPANRGRICDQGLWAWSRHPNYFFEWLGWLAYPVMAMEAGHPASWLTLSGPLVIYWLLVHVSGVPPLEAHLRRSRPAEFAAYAENVNAFWPRPPHRSRALAKP